jgi:hypothetical protein
MGELIRVHCRHCRQTYLSKASELEKCDLCRKTGGMERATSISAEPGEALQTLAARITARLKQGESPETLRAELISQGVRPDEADRLLADWLARWGHLKPGGLLHVLGSALVLGGLVLAWENQTGAFPTFPFAGALMTVIGLGILGIGIAGVGRQRGTNVEVSPPNQAPEQTRRP